MLILFAHGAGAPSASAWMRAWARRLGALGEVVTFDYPYMRAKRKSPDKQPVLIAAHAQALAEARARHPQGPVVLAGKSMGSRMGCHLAAEQGGVDALVCFGYPLRSGATGALRDEVLRALRTPILFLQGSKDPLCPLADLARVRGQMTAPNELHVVEGGNHSLEVGVRDLRAAGRTQEEVDAEVLAVVERFLRGLARVITPAGDQAFEVRLGTGVDEETSARVLAAAERLLAARPPGVDDVVPGYDTLLVLYDPLRADPADVRAFIAGALDGAVASPAARSIEIPVLYDPEVAADLTALAADKGLSIDELVALHSGAVYRAYLLGFRPGFPFLRGLDQRLHAARLATPRLRVPAGAVGIGGEQTGIYPVESPGGWRLIGRTPLRLFDPARADPFLVHAGDRVRFVPIDRATFDRLGGA